MGTRIWLIELNDCWQLLICIQMVILQQRALYAVWEENLVFLWISHFMSILKAEFSFFPEISAQILLIYMGNFEGQALFTQWNLNDFFLCSLSRSFSLLLPPLIQEKFQLLLFVEQQMSREAGKWATEQVDKCMKERLQVPRQQGNKDSMCADT